MPRLRLALSALADFARNVWALTSVPMQAALLLLVLFGSLAEVPERPLIGVPMTAAMSVLVGVYVRRRVGKGK